MATSTIFTLSSLIHTQTPCNLSIPLSLSTLYYKTNNTIKFICSSSSSTQSITVNVPSNSSVNDNLSQKWEGYRKRKVLMRVGYVGLDNGDIEKELETAIYKAGGIRDSNFGDLNKIAWATSSQIDDEVHSLSTMISFKMEIPENAWIDDPNGISLANVVNTYLPKNIKVFSILPSQKGFNAQEECNMRKYGYLLPLEVIGITSNFTEAEVQHHLLEFNNILSFFEGKHPFHNYTVPSEYKEIDECDEEEVLRTDEMVTECVDGEQMPGRSIGSDKESDVIENSLDDPLIFGKWLHEPDENDRITDIHFRYIFQSSCGKVKHLFGRSYVEISICGESFMLHQIRKMVGAAIAVKRGLLPRDIIPLSLNKFTRFVLPIAPSDVLFLRWNHFILEKESGKAIRPEILTSVESEEILNDADDFYESVMLPTFSEYLDPLKSPWKEWVELLDSKTKIPDSQLDEIRSAWATWEENFWVKTDAAMYYSS